MPPVDHVKGVQRIESGAAYEATGLVHRVRVPTNSSASTHPTLVMVHGLYGDDSVAWIFARVVSPEWLIVTPRAYYPLKSGYSWYKFEDELTPEAASFDLGCAAFTHFMQSLPKVYPVDASRVVILGFSQGAVMAYAYATQHRICGVAGLSSYVPDNINLDSPTIPGLPVLMLHGTRDETVPVARARADRDRLASAGAHVHYHEDDIGHKVSAEGMRQLGAWLEDRARG
jgi:phospholipase/carboxylesterase